MTPGTNLRGIIDDALERCAFSLTAQFAKPIGQAVVEFVKTKFLFDATSSLDPVGSQPFNDRAVAAASLSRSRRHQPAVVPALPARRRPACRQPAAGGLIESAVGSLDVGRGHGENAIGRGNARAQGPAYQHGLRISPYGLTLSFCSHLESRGNGDAHNARLPVDRLRCAREGAGDAGLDGHSSFADRPRPEPPLDYLQLKAG